MKLISSKKLLHTPIFEVTMDHAVDPDGFKIKRAIVQHGGSAVMRKELRSHSQRIQQLEEESGASATEGDTYAPATLNSICSPGRTP